MVYPTPVALLGDIPAISSAMLVSFNSMSEKPDANYEVPAKYLDNVDIPLSSFKRRNEAEIRKIFDNGWGEYQNLNKKKLSSEEKDAALFEISKPFRALSLSELPLFMPDEVKGVEIISELFKGGSMRIRESALAGFYGVDCYDLPTPDILHTVYKGPCDQLVNACHASGALGRLLPQDTKHEKSKEVRTITKRVSIIPKIK
jgi:hypothetical protein